MIDPVSHGRLRKGGRRRTATTSGPLRSKLDHPRMREQHVDSLLTSEISMGLAQIADLIEHSADLGYEAEIRAWLNNVIRCLRAKHVGKSGIKRRFNKIINVFDFKTSVPRKELQTAFIIASAELLEMDHYRRPERLEDFLDCKALTLQSDCEGGAGQFWLGHRAFAKVIAERFAAGACKDYVGPPGKPLWLTPYHGELRALCEEASVPDLTIGRRASLAEALVGRLGLCHFNPGEGILAFVTARTIGELAFFHPHDKDRCLPVGSTAIEARAHRRFRPWPAEPGAVAYGRTYDLDASRRGPSGAATSTHGVPEANRPRMEMTEFDTCIYVGVLGATHFNDSDEEYLKEIAARRPSYELLRSLSRSLKL